MSLLHTNTYLIFDFDSTFVKLETLEVIAEIYLKNNHKKEQIQEKIKDITNLGMEGKISFRESLERRMKLLKLDKDNIQKCIAILKENISDSFVKNKNFFLENSSNIYILSGGFQEVIEPVVKEFGIRAENIIANELIFEDDEVTAVNPDHKLLEAKGKPKAVKELNLKGTIIMIGDGYTDLEVKLEGAAQKFIAYCENIKRDAVIEHSDLVAYSLDDVFTVVH